MVNKTGIWAPLAYIAISFLQVTFIPIPGMVSILAGILLFEPWQAFLYSLIGMFLGGSFGFYLGRVLGKKFVYWIVGIYIHLHISNFYIPCHIPVFFK